MFTLSLLFLIETFSRSRSFAINHESRHKRIRETSRIRNNMNASILRIRFLINEFGDKEKSCRFWYVIKKQKKRRKKKKRGKNIGQDERKGEWASMWSILGCRVVAQRTILIGPSPPVGWRGLWLSARRACLDSLSRTRTAHRWGCCIALCR